MSEKTKAAPGSADFDADAPGVTADQVEQHLRLLTARRDLKALTAEAAPAAALVPETTKYNKLTGLPVVMSEQAWGLLTPEYQQEFVPTPVPAPKPVELQAPIDAQ